MTKYVSTGTIQVKLVLNGKSDESAVIFRPDSNHTCVSSSKKHAVFLEYQKETQDLKGQNENIKSIARAIDDKDGGVKLKLDSISKKYIQTLVAVARKCCKVDVVVTENKKSKLRLKRILIPASTPSDTGQ